MKFYLYLIGFNKLYFRAFLSPQQYWEEIWRFPKHLVTSQHIAFPAISRILSTQETSVGTHYCHSGFPESIRIQRYCFIWSGFDQIYKDVCPQMQRWLCGTCYARPKFGCLEPCNATCSSKSTTPAPLQCDRRWRQENFWKLSGHLP